LTFAVGRGQFWQVPLSLYQYSLEALGRLLEADGVRPVHARVLWKAMYHDLQSDDLRERSDLPPPLRRWVESWMEARRGCGEGVRIQEHCESQDARTHKLLLGFSDASEVETVVMAYPGRHTACVSTQVGCAMGCVFCATGQMGFRRHLSVGEIVAQVVEAQRLLRARGLVGLRNLVLMGMGEPLHNYDAVMEALAVVSDRGGLNLGPSRICISTVGVVPGILRMAREQRPYHLAVSLHGVDDAERSALLPLNQRWPLADLLAACREYEAVTARRIVFGWTLIRGRNDSLDHARRLGELLSGMRAHVNLIRLNPTEGFDARSASDAEAEAFRDEVQRGGIPCTIRQHRGLDVAAGCGQLRVSRGGGTKRGGRA
jgi:23S rRNA (adenine2503-C2)-methyltransferase